MKRLAIALSAILGIFALTNCQRDNLVGSETISSNIPFEFTASLQTKTSNNGLSTNWVAGDTVNVFHAVAGTSSYVNDGKFTIISDNLEAGKFTGSLSQALVAATSYDWYVMYPYSSFLTAPANSTDGARFYIGSRSDRAQSQVGNDNMAHIAGANYPLFGKVTGVDASAPLTVNLSQLTSLLKIVVTNTLSEAVSVDKVSFATETEDIVGSYYIDYSANPITYTAAKETWVSKVANLDVSEVSIAPNATGTFYIGIKPFVAHNGDELTVSVVSGSNTYDHKITLSKDVTFSAGKIKTVNAQVVPQSPSLWTLVDPALGLKDGEYVILAHTKDDATKLGYLPNATTSSAPIYSTQTIFDGATSEYSHVVPAAMIWNFTRNSDGTYTITNADGKKLYGTNSNNSIKVGDTNGKWTINTHAKNSNAFAFSFAATTSSTRYLGVYNEQDWRCYDKLYGNNFGDNGESSQIFLYYQGTIEIEPAISSVDNLQVGARETSGSTDCSVLNPTNGVSLSCACDGSVVTNVSLNAEANTLSYTVSANTTTSSRAGSITLTYGALTKTISVSQDAPAFSSTKTEVTLGAAEGANTSITITSDFDWTAGAFLPDGATVATGYTITPMTFTWNGTNNGKQSIKITASGANTSESGTATLGKIIITNAVTNQTLEIVVKQESSYVPPVQGSTATINFGSAAGSFNFNTASATFTDELNNTWVGKVAGTTSFTANPAYSHIGSSKSPASSITLETTLPAGIKLTSLEGKFGGFSGTTGAISFSLDGTTLKTGALNASTDVVVTYQNAGGQAGTNVKISITNIAKGVKIYYIRYSYE